jgi:hypothetical protein
MRQKYNSICLQHIHLCPPSDNGGTLTVSDGTHATNLALLGNYMAASFVTASDGPRRNPGHCPDAIIRAATYRGAGPLQLTLRA